MVVLWGCPLWVFLCGLSPLRFPLWVVSRGFSSVGCSLGLSSVGFPLGLSSMGFALGLSSVGFPLKVVLLSELSSGGCRLFSWVSFGLVL